MVAAGGSCGAAVDGLGRHPAHVPEFVEARLRFGSQFQMSPRAQSRQQGCAA